MADSRIIFGGSGTPTGRMIWKGQWSSSVNYFVNDVVFNGGNSYIAVADSFNVATSVTTSWSIMASGNAVTSVNGRVGAITLSSSDLSDKDATNGVAGLDASGFLKPAEFNEGVDAVVATTYAIVAGDRGRIKTFSNTSPVAISIAQATGSFAAGWFVTLENINTGLCTITAATSLIEGSATVTLKQWESVTLVSAGGQYLALRSKVRAAFSDITGSVAAAQLPNPSATTLGGVESIAAVSTKFLTSISTSGVPAQAQPAFTDISGTATGAQLPLPAAATKGGVFSKAAVTHQFLTSISSADGSIGQAQPAAADLSDGVTGTGAVVLASAPTIAHPVITTGVTQGSGFKHQRFGATCTTAATADTACNSTYTWTSAFADASYSVVCQGEGNVGNVAALFVQSQTASTVTISVVTYTSTAVSFSAVHCIAVHD